MASGTFYPAVSADDGKWKSAEFNSNYNDFVFGHDGNSVHSFIRFLNVTIPAGSTITSAYIRFTAAQTLSGNTVNVKISFNDVDDAVAPTNVAGADALVLTAAKVDWNAIAAWTDGNTYDTPSIVTAIQEIVDRGGWSSGNAMMGLVKDNSASSYRKPSAVDYSSGAEKAELHVEWTPAITAEITEDVGIADTYASVVLAAIIAEAFGLSDSCAFETPYREIIEDCGIDDTLARSFETFNSITDGVGIADAMVGIFEIFVSITDSAGIADAYAKFIEINKSIQDDLSSDDLHEAIRLYRKTIAEALSSWDTLKWSWSKSVTDSLAITETIAKRLGIPVRDWLTLTDTETTNWSGVEAISDSLYIIDISKAIRAYVDAIADGMAITDAVNLALEMLIIDILTCTDTGTSVWKGARSVESTFALSDTTALKKVFADLVADGIDIVDVAKIFLELIIAEELTCTDAEANVWSGVRSVESVLTLSDITSLKKAFTDLITDGMSIIDVANLFLGMVIADELKAVDSIQDIGKFRHSAEETITLSDVIKRAFPKSLTDSLAITDVSLIDFLTLLQLADSFDITEVTTPGLTISQVIADSLEALDTAAIKQLLQELIQEGLNIDVSVVIDGEVYECFVLNTSAFHVSVYSNYDYNSFALLNNVAYGCKSDGIYKLTGTTDDGATIRAGIVLPKTDFGLMNKKRMRKAWLAVDGNNLILKLETESGNKTFRMVDAECSLSRDLKGRRWLISVEGFDSLDSINLTPVILSKK